jgi:hypothetical protein
MGRSPGVEVPQYGLEELPRPVVTFLLNECRQKPHDALVECLRELADDGVVRYETDAAGLPVFRLLAQAPRSGRPLLPFEEVALRRVRKRAGRLGLVPFSALITDEGDDYEEWAKQQQEELGQAARQAGLAVKSAPRGSWRITLALIAVALGTVLYVHTVDWKLGDRIFAPVLIAAFLALFVPLCLRRWRLTPTGGTAVDSLRSYGYGSAGLPKGLHPDSGRTAYNRQMRLPDAVTFTGEVVKLRFVDGGSDSPDEHLAWIDDGSPVSMKLEVGSALYQRLSVGTHVQVNWSPRRRSLNSLTLATAAADDNAGSVPA